MNGIILEDMTRHTVYENPQYSKAHDNGVLLYMIKQRLHVLLMAKLMLPQNDSHPEWQE